MHIAINTWGLKKLKYIFERLAQSAIVLNLEVEHQFKSLTLISTSSGRNLGGVKF